MKKIDSVETLITEGGLGGDGIMSPAHEFPLLSRVKEKIKNGELSEAIRAIEEAEPYLMGGDAIERGLLFHLRCLIAHKQGAYERSIEAGEDACQILSDKGQNSLAGETRRIIAKSRVLLGLIDQAIMDFEESLLLLRKSGETEMGLAGINDLAQAYFIQGKWQLAKELLERGLRQASCYGVQNLMYSFTMNLGTLSFALGEVEEAKNYFNRCTEMLRENNSASACRLLIMKGNLSMLTEDVSDAHDHFRSAMWLAKEKGLRRELALIYEGSAEVAMERGEIREADSNLTAALEIARGLAPRGDLVNEILRRKGDAALRQGRMEEAKEALERSIAISRHLGDRLEEGAACGLMGEVCCRMGNLEMGKQHFEKAFEMLGGLDEKWERGRLLLRAAIALREVHGAASVAKECLRYLEKASELFHELKLKKSQALVDLEMGTLLFELGEFDRASRFALKAHEGFQSGGYFEEKAKTRKLIESIEEILARRSIQRSQELISNDIAFTLTVDDEVARERVAQRIDLIRDRCSLDGGFLIDLDSNNRPVFVVTSMLDENLAISILMRLITLTDREKSPLIAVLNTQTDTRYGSIDELKSRGITSFLLWSSYKTGDVYRYLYFERSDPEKTALNECDLILIEALAKDLVSKASWNTMGKRGNGEWKKAIDLDSDYEGIITCSHQFKDVLGIVEKIKDSSIPVLLEGETGTGKELIARAIHEKGCRRGNKFFAVNCAAIPENLLESELFGHKRGAFTGAVRDKIGLFEVANGGTFFLDEIGDMGQGVQVKLLRFLEEGEFKRLGDIEVRRVDVRVLSATNKNLNDEVECGNFRKDLFYRLNGIRIQIPPLRERKEDIPLLVDWYLNKYVKEEGKKVRGVKRDALKMLLSFDWPGNVRELVNELRRAITLVDEGGWIGPAHLSEKITRYGDADFLWIDASGRRNRTGSTSSDLPGFLAKLERQKILEAMKVAGGVKLRAAQHLGLHEATLRGKLKKYRIGPAEWEI
ncbi:MAG: sigma 54-interacting transcriptional regulator [Candidatus Glassbacteria bacterium]